MFWLTSFKAKKRLFPSVGGRFWLYPKAAQHRPLCSYTFTGTCIMSQVVGVELYSCGQNRFDLYSFRIKYEVAHPVVLISSWAC